MKKILFLAITSLLMASCNDNKSHLNGQEAQPLTDTIQTSENTPEGTANDSAVSQAAPSIDESAINEIMQQQINEEYKKGLSVKAGKETVKLIPETTITKMTLPLIVDNKTSITWEKGDYEITYSYLTEYWTEDGEEDRWFPKKVRGLQVGPNGKVTITDKNDGWEFRNVKLKTKLSKEKFTQRFKEQTVFDKAQNKFIPKKP